MDFNSINHFKSVFVHQFFVKAADHNYVVARWARIVGLTRESFIQAHQAVEKYLKAALVINDVPVLKYGHDILALFERHLEVFKDIAVIDLEKPNRLDSKFWIMPKASRFIEHIEINGNPSARYRLASFAAYKSDLFHLDELVRRIRQLTIGMTWKIGQDWPASEDLVESIGLTYKEALLRYPRLQVRGPILSQNEAGREISLSLNDAILMGNIAFYEDLAPDYRKVPTTVASWLGPFENSYLYLLAKSLQEGRASQDLRDGTRWITDSISLPKAVRDELRDLASRS